jgi:riboflavin transporter
MKNITIKQLVYCSLLAALGAVFSAFLSIEIPFGGSKIVEISLAPVCVMLAGILFGPLLGGLVGFVADTAGFFLGAQHGAYNPIFSVTMALFGVIAGLFYLKDKKIEWIKILIISIVAQVVCSILLNTFAINLFYGVPLKVLFPPRIISALVEIPVYFVLLLLLAKRLVPFIRKERVISNQ